MNKIFYTDGACSGNPGPGGYAVVSLEENELVYSYVEDFLHTTNNRMELMAILHVMKLAAEDKENDYLVYSDSAYAINYITNWIYGWARNGWMNSKKKQVENIDLMQEIYQYVEFPMLNFKLEKVHGHDGLLGNELADSLAANNRKKFDDLIYKNDIILCNILDK